MSESSEVVVAIVVLVGARPLPLACRLRGPALARVTRPPRRLVRTCLLRCLRSRCSAAPHYAGKVPRSNARRQSSAVLLALVARAPLPSRSDTLSEASVDVPLLPARCRRRLLRGGVPVPRASRLTPAGARAAATAASGPPGESETLAGFNPNAYASSTTITRDDRQTAFRAPFFSAQRPRF